MEIKVEVTRMQPASIPVTETGDAAVRSSTMPKDTDQDEREKESATVVDVDALVERANTMARQAGVAVHFRKSEISDEMILEVVDEETGDVIRQIPPEEMERRMKHLAGLKGLLAELEG